MSAVQRRAFGLIILCLLLAACTRERVAPVSIPTLAVDEDAITTSSTPVPQPNSALITLPEESDLPPGVTPELEPDVEEIGATTTPEHPETFAYTVRAGDTLTGLAERFETDVATIRNLNALDSEVLAVGQPLNIPYIEGMTAEGAPTPTPGPFIYTIQAGDTLSAIAARFGIDQIRIVEHNNLLDPNNLVVGSTITIPGYEAPPTDAAGTPAAESGTPSATTTSFIHIVQPGEGLLEIASRYGVDVNTIATANNLVNRNMLRAGQEIIIPGVTPQQAAAARGVLHIVQPGESLLGISLRYGVTVPEIIEANEITNPDSISVGQQLIIPSN